MSRKVTPSFRIYLFAFMISFWGCSSASRVPASTSKSPDPKSSECNILSPADSETPCSCHILSLHPTQISVGMKEVHRKKKKLEGLTRSGIEDFKYDQENREPVVIGPQGVAYITDHHHLALALHNAGESETWCKVVANVAKKYEKDSDEFWTYMKESHYVYLKNELGETTGKDKKPLTPFDLPRSVDRLHDDPFRSLAGEVRRAGGYVKPDPSFYFVEFQWADFFRNQKGKNRITVKDIENHWDKTLARAIDLAISPAAAQLPGYVSKRAKPQD